MKLGRNLSIGSKLTLGSSIFIVFVLVIIGLCSVSSNNITSILGQTGYIQAPAAIASSHAQVHLLRMIVHIQHYLIFNDLSIREQYIANEQSFQEDLQTLVSLIEHLEPDDQERVRELHHIVPTWQSRTKRIFENQKTTTGTKEQALQVFSKEIVPLINHTQNLLQHITEHQQQSLSNTMRYGQHHLEQTQQMMIFIGIIVAIVGIAISLMQHNMIVVPIQHLTKEAINIRNGNLDTSVTVNTHDEIGIFAETFNSMTKQLRHKITELTKTEEQLVQSRNELERRVQERTQELLQTNNALKHLMDHHKLILEAAGEGIICLDTQGTITFANRAAQLMLGYAETELIGQPCTILTNHPQSDTLINQGPSFPTCTVVQEEFPQRTEDKIFWRKDGIPFPVSYLNTPMIENHTFMGTVVLFQDITERKTAEQRLRHQALHDALTGLPNRTLFIEFLEQSIKDAQRCPDHTFAVLFIDLDNFKVVNDSLGHLEGDRLLITIADRLRSCLRSNDIVARFGGDEFVVLLEDIHNIDNINTLANRIQQQIAEPLKLKGNLIIPSASIGIVMSSSDYTQPIDILRDADTAMYQAKTLGKNRYIIFDMAMHANIVERLHIETALRQAIENHELRLHYQPIVELTNKRIVGFEALLRWYHPQWGIILPGEFLPFAEETGLISTIDWWVLQEACRQMHVWNKQFPHLQPLTISVNLSSRTLTQNNVVETIQEILDNTGLHPSCLKIEITENMVIEHNEITMTTLNQLRDMNIRLCIDDFGTGYSSLRYLHRFPFHTLKIDKSFVFPLHTDTESNAITQSIIMLSHTLAKEVIAEGVENHEQLSHLQGMHCEYGQGFLFSKAVDSTTAEKFLQMGNMDKQGE